MSTRKIAELSPRLASVVAFEMGGELMGLPTDILREVLETRSVTPVPCAGEFSAGLINIRGVIIPVADWRPMFGMPQKEATRDTRVLILETSVNDQPLTVGVIAEKVHAIVAIDPDTLRPVPAVGTIWPQGSMQAVARWDNRFVALPDVEGIFESQLEKELDLAPAV